MSQPRITISLPCYKRPQRTIRAIESILAQTVQDFELLITSDGDMDIWMVLLKWFKVEHISSDGINIHKNRYTIKLTMNPVHEGKWGTEIRNQHIQAATGKYFMFMGSDDVLLPNHLENILGMIEERDLDLVCFDVWLNPLGVPRNTQLKKDHCGHNDTIFRTELLKQAPPHEPVYGHDYACVKYLMYISDKCERVGNRPQTYHVMSLPGHLEQGID